MSFFQNNKTVRKILKIAPLLFLLMFAAVVFKSSLRLNYFRYNTFNSNKFDLGNMAQVVWNTAQGRFFQFTDVFGENISRLSYHADLLMVFFAPLFWVHSDPSVLLFAQNLLLVSSVFPLYFLVKEKLQSNWLALIWGVAFLLYPAFGYLLLSDFHAVALVVPLFIFAFFFLDKDKLIPFWVCVLLALLAKEEISLIIFMLGIYIAIFCRRVKLGAAVSTVGFVWVVLLFFFVFPYFGNLRAQSQTKFLEILQAGDFFSRAGIAQNHFLTRYSYFGNSYFSIIRNIFFKPLRTLRYVFSLDNRIFLFKLFAPAGFLSFLSPAVLSVSLPEFAVNLLSNSSSMKTIKFQYTASIIPFVFLSALYGVDWLRTRCRSISTEATTRVATTLLSLFMLFSCIWGMQEFDSPLWPYFKRGGPLVKFEPVLVYVQEFIASEEAVEDIAGGVAEEIADGEDEESTEETSLVGKKVGNIPYSNPKHNGAAQAVVDLIPQDPDVSVSAPNFLGAHLSLRKSMALFPGNYLEADYTVVDLVLPQFMHSVQEYEITGEIPYYVRKLLNNKDYNLIYSGNGLLVFSRLRNQPDFDYQIGKVRGPKEEKIVYKKGLAVTGWEIPDAIVRSEKTSVSFNYSLNSSNFGRKILVSTLRSRSDGYFYQEIHLPSFAILSTTEWDIGDVYEEDIQFIVPERVPEGEYNYILSVVNFDNRADIESRFIKQVVVE